MSKKRVKFIGGKLKKQPFLTKMKMKVKKSLQQEVKLPKEEGVN